MTIEIRTADFDEASHCQAVVDLLEAYALEPMGGGTPLRAEVKQRLIPALREQAGAAVLLAFRGREAVGLATCFLGFSTFEARPLLNVHDLAVLARHRRQGIARALLVAAEQRALQQNCCKLTLEVRNDNAGARALYESFGFRDFQLAGVPVATLFLAKPLPG